MNTFTIFLQAYLVQRRRAAGKHQSASRFRAEAQLLEKETKAFLAKTIDRTADDPFIRFNGDIISQSPRDIDGIDGRDLLQSLAFPGQSLILTQPNAGEDVVWTYGEALPDGLHFLWPLPVNAAAVEMSSHKGHLKRTRREPLFWDRVSVDVHEKSIPEFTVWLKTGKARVRAVVASKGGVTVIFKSDAIDYASWSSAARDLKTMMARHKIAFSPISLSTLVSVSREPRGCGALLYLA